MAGRFPPHLSLLGGFLMGSADAVPGVSGGTIALVIGIYERFIGALATAVRLPFLLRTREGRRELASALGFLIPLAIGLLVAYYLATKLLVGPLESPGILRRPATAPICYAFFFGLVLVSVREPWRRMRTGGAAKWLAAAVGFAAAAGFAHLPHGGAETALWPLLFGGAGAIAIMLLPGVSGSLFLVVIGQYNTVAGAAHDRNLGVLAVFLVGIALGLITFVPLLRLLLRRAHDTTMATLTGLMAGSLFVLYPWKDGYETTQPMRNIAPSADNWWAVALAFVGGCAVVLLLNLVERRMNQPNQEVQ